MDFDRSIFAAEFIAAGMWSPIRVTNSDDESTDGHAGYHRPDFVRNGGQLSADHEIKYQAADFPDLAEGDVVEFLDDAGDPIAGKTFRVRQAPYVTDDPSSDRSGYFMRALLTSIADIVDVETFYELLESGDFSLLESGDHELTEASV